MNEFFRLSCPYLNEMEYFFLDIDETMGYAVSIEDDKEWTKLFDKKYCKVITSNDQNTFFWFPRPNIEEFLNFIIPRVKGWGVWTSGSKDYAHSIVEKFLMPMGYQPDWVFHFGNCSIDKDSGIVRKNISSSIKGIENKKAKWLNERYSQDALKKWKNLTLEKIWLIDDLTNHFTRKTYGLIIKPYDPQLREKDYLFKNLIKFFSK
jgi:hypothetical protein